MKRSLIKSTLLSLVAICSAKVANAQPNFGGFQMPEVKMEYSAKYADINYAGDENAYHTMDIYLPKVEKESYPVVVHIYGSAWFSNNSKGMADLGTIVQAYLNAGYAVVTPNHRSSSDAKYPAQIHDIKAVIRFIRGEAAKYKFDTSFIATSGFSSGGHLSSLAATTSNTKKTNVGEIEIDLEGNIGKYTDQSSAVNAACDWSGPIDLLNMDCGGPRGMQMSPEEALLGCKIPGNEDTYKSLSPISYIDPSDPPIIIFHGTDDNVVPPCQGLELYNYLKMNKVETDITIVEKGGHGMNMYSEENLNKMVDFMNNVRNNKK